MWQTCFWIGFLTFSTVKISFDFVNKSWLRFFSWVRSHLVLLWLKCKAKVEYPVFDFKSQGGQCLKTLARILGKTALFLPSQCSLFLPPHTSESVCLHGPHHGMLRACPGASCRALHKSFCRFLFTHRAIVPWAREWIALWERGWGLVYMALSTVDGFTGYTHHCTWEEQYRLGKADHPEANPGPVFLGRHQFLLCAGTDVFVVLWNQPGNWSSLKLTRSQRGKEVNFNLDTAQLLVARYLEKGWWGLEWAAMTEVKVRLLLLGTDTCLKCYSD